MLARVDPIQAGAARGQHTQRSYTARTVATSLGQTGGRGAARGLGRWSRLNVGAPRPARQRAWVSAAKMATSGAYPTCGRTWRRRRECAARRQSLSALGAVSFARRDWRAAVPHRASRGHGCRRPHRREEGHRAWPSNSSRGAAGMPPPAARLLFSRDPLPARAARCD
jgi:hypothetical protein